MNDGEPLRYPYFIRVGLRPELKWNKITNILVKKRSFNSNYNRLKVY